LNTDNPDQDNFKDEITKDFYMSTLEEGDEKNPKDDISDKIR